MLRKALLAAGAFAAPVIVTAMLVSAPIEASAQSAICMPQDEMFRALENSFEELPVEAGITMDDHIIVLTRSLDGETWTLVLLRRDGIACAITGGIEWTRLSIGEGA